MVKLNTSAFPRSTLSVKNKSWKDRQGWNEKISSSREDPKSCRTQEEKPRWRMQKQRECTLASAWSTTIGKGRGLSSRCSTIKMVCNQAHLTLGHTAAKVWPCSTLTRTWRTRGPSQGHTIWMMLCTVFICLAQPRCMAHIWTWKGKLYMLVNPKCQGRRRLDRQIKLLVLNLLKWTISHQISQLMSGVKSRSSLRNYMNNRSKSRKMNMSIKSNRSRMCLTSRLSWEKNWEISRL